MRMVRRSEIIEDVQFQFLMHNGMLMRTQVCVVVCFLCFLSSVVVFLTFVSYLEREEFKLVGWLVWMSQSQCFFITGTVGLGAVVSAAAAAYLPARWG